MNSIIFWRTVRFFARLRWNDWLTVWGPFFIFFVLFPGAILTVFIIAHILGKIRIAFPESFLVAGIPVLGYLVFRLGCLLLWRLAEWKFNKEVKLSHRLSFHHYDEAIGEICKEIAKLALAIHNSDKHILSQVLKAKKNKFRITILLARTVMYGEIPQKIRDYVKMAKERRWQ